MTEVSHGEILAAIKGFRELYEERGRRQDEAVAQIAKTVVDMSATLHAVEKDVAVMKAEAGHRDIEMQAVKVRQASFDKRLRWLEMRAAAYAGGAAIASGLLTAAIMRWLGN